jgi:hypothetical protein
LHKTRKYETKLQKILNGSKSNFKGFQNPVFGFELTMANRRFFGRKKILDS